MAARHLDITAVLHRSRDEDTPPIDTALFDVGRLAALVAEDPVPSGDGVWAVRWDRDDYLALAVDGPGRPDRNTVWTHQGREVWPGRPYTAQLTPRDLAAAKTVVIGPHAELLVLAIEGLPRAQRCPSIFSHPTVHDRDAPYAVGAPVHSDGLNGLVAGADWVVHTTGPGVGLAVRSGGQGSGLVRW